MRASRNFHIPAAAGLALGMIVSAQSPPPASAPPAAADVKSVTPEPAPSPSPSVAVEPPSLIPPNILPGPAAGALPQIPLLPEVQQINQPFKQSFPWPVADGARLHFHNA